MKLRKPEEKWVEHNIEAHTASPFNGGSEMSVSRLSLKYATRRVDGFILKEPNEKNNEWVKQQLNYISEKWKELRAINARRKAENKPTFNLPATVRLFRDGDRQGLLMTDLSKNGLYRIFDLKELLNDPYIVDAQGWNQIKEQVEHDIQAAQEEKIDLANGPKYLDPWIIARKPEGYKVYLSDIGGYTTFYDRHSQHPGVIQMMERSHKNLTEAIQKIDALIRQLPSEF